MGHLTLELILWLLLAFLIGCILGCLFRKLFGAKPQAATPAPAPVKAPEPAKVPEPAAPAASKAVTKVEPKPIVKVEPKPIAKVEPKPVALAATGVAKRPKGLAGARAGKADELQRISGIGPKIDKTLHSLGFFHFDQIANWTPDEVQWVDEHLRFKGRIEREEWIPQAKLLAAGNESEFTRLYGTGGMKTGTSGKAVSGERTRKAASTATAKSTAKPAPKKATEKKPEPKKTEPKTEKPKKAEVATGVASAPKKLTGARGGKPDDLQQISGVGPKLEKTLHSLGFYHFDQIAEWTPDEVQWVDENLTFKGRIEREEWIPQCKLLAAGNMEEFTKLYGTGGLKSKKTGKSQSGSRTRKS